MKITTDPTEQFADVRARRELSIEDCKRVAAKYLKAHSEGRIRKPMPLFVARAIHAAATEGR
jgi:hypothetical protein